MADRLREMARLNPLRAKIHRSYLIAEVARLFGVHRNTVRYWVRSGMPAHRCGREWLILGRELREFLAARQKARRRTLAPGELYCLRCRSPRWAREGSIHITDAGAPTVDVAAECWTCGTTMHRRVARRGVAAAGFEPDAQPGGEPPSR